MCKGCTTPVTNPVICPTCGISSHPGSSCLLRCSHPWQTGKLLDCSEPTTAVSPNSEAYDINKNLLEKISDVLDSKLKKLENNFMVFQSSIDVLNSTLNNINTRINDLTSRMNKLESHTNNQEESIIKEIVERNKRSHNLISFNLDENPSQSDKTAIKNILDTILSVSCNTSITIRRLGNKNSGEKILENIIRDLKMLPNPNMFRDPNTLRDSTSDGIPAALARLDPTRPDSEMSGTRTPLEIRHRSISLTRDPMRAFTVRGSVKSNKNLLNMIHTSGHGPLVSQEAGHPTPPPIKIEGDDERKSLQ
ncbi:hypothetical protein WN55_06263 [Dufourea novaeangliae]|uniref:Uncharacterized protein n=1 Tax=Dufourea novaeangliae TaxID=178035 RepID=A0A154PS21_DUFNO|nr:hypothetical protein WN55_06263 [Dufourea novaeangliae]